MTSDPVRDALDEALIKSLDEMAFAQGALRQYHLEKAHDEGFEYGVLATENGLGRA